MHSETTLDLSTTRINVKVRPPMRYNPPVLVIDSGVAQLNLHASNEQLADIAEAIQRHLQAVRYHETPDQQQILNQEYENLTEVAV